MKFFLALRIAIAREREVICILAEQDGALGAEPGDQGFCERGLAGAGPTGQGEQEGRAVWVHLRCIPACGALI